MRSFKGNQPFSSTQQQIYSPSRTTYQNRVMNATQNSRTKNRTQQIVLLHEQFQDLKKKIKQVQNKNEKIIEKIHRECNFKKKTPQTYNIGPDPSEPIVYYEKKERSQVSGMSIDESNKSDQSEFEFRQKKSSSVIKQRASVQSNKHLPGNHSKFTQSMEYPKPIPLSQEQLSKKYSKISQQYQDQSMGPQSQQILDDHEEFEDDGIEPQSRMRSSHQTYQHFNDYPKKGSSNKKSTIFPGSQTLMGFSSNNFVQPPKPQQSSLIMYQLQQSLKIQKQKITYLQQQLKSKQMELLTMKKDFNRMVSHLDSVEIILEDQLEGFMENVVKKGFFEIEKQVRRIEARLRNLGMRIQDQYEEHKSSKLIKEHQLRRSNSRSRRDISPGHNTSTYSSSIPSQLSKIPRPTTNPFSQSQFLPTTNPQPSLTSLPLDKKSRISQSNSKKNKQFQQIVKRYEQMINTKNNDISKLQQKLVVLSQQKEQYKSKFQSKQSQVKQIRQKLQQLQKLMSQTYHQQPIPSFTSNNKLTKLNLNTNQPQPPHFALNPRRSSSADTNLLEDIYHSSSQQQHQLQLKRVISEHQVTIRQLQEKLSKVRRQTEVEIKEKDTVIERKEVELREKVKMIERKEQEKRQLEVSVSKEIGDKYSMQLQRKQSQLRQIVNRLSVTQKRMVQKQCQIVSLTNKLKKLQSTNQSNYKKLQQYQKLLTNYQHNPNLDDSTYLTAYLQPQHQPTQQHSPQQSDKKPHPNLVTVAKSQLANMEGELERLSQQVLSLTKRVKVMEGERDEKGFELERVTEELGEVRNSNGRLQKENGELREKVERLQEEVERLGNDNQQDDRGGLGLGGEQLQLQQQQQQQQQPYNRNIQDSQHSLSEHSHHHKKTFSHPTINHQNSTNNNSNPLHNTTTSQQLITLKQKHCQLSTLYSTLKSQHLQLSRINITLKKDNQYLKQCLIDREAKYQKYRKQSQQLKAKLHAVEQQLTIKQQQLSQQKQQNNTKIQQLQRQWLQFEQQITRNNNPEPILSSANNIHEQLTSSQLSNQQHNLHSSRYNLSESSLLISSTLHSKNYLQQQNEYLTIKLKQAQATIQMHNLMEDKVVQQYKANLQKVKAQLKQKGRQVQKLMKELQLTKDQKRRLQVMYESCRNYQLVESRVGLERSNTTHTLIGGLGNNGSMRGNHGNSRDYKNNRSNDNNNNNDTNCDNTNNNTDKDPITTTIRKRLLSSSSQPQPQQQQPIDIMMDEFPSYNQQTNLSMTSQLPIQQPITTQHNLHQTQQQQQQRLYPYQKILQLQGQLKQAKDINKKLQEMQQQLFKQIRLKEQQKKDLLRLLDEKMMKIQQLEEIVELKEQNVSNSHLGSNILSSNHKTSSQHKHSQQNLSQRQSLHSHSSLRYSGITRNHLLNPSGSNLNPNPSYLNPSSTHHLNLNIQQLGQSQHSHTSQRFQIQLSQTGSQLLDKSYVTNISQIFQRQQFPYEKVQLKRKQQVKLFQKTASYIKSLKDSITQKTKRIKLLQKKIQSLKANHHTPIQSKYEISTRDHQHSQKDIQCDWMFKDYESVQLERRKASHNKRYKNIEHQWKLAIEENNVLMNQVEVLQEQLEKAEEQENSILKMKDLYKEEIKKLISKNQAQTAYYEDLLAKEKQRVEQSQSVHNLQTIKQLFIKVVEALIVMQSQKSKKKRQEKRKQLEQFFKIFASLCSIDQTKKNAIVQGIKRMTLNIVLPQ